jgi:RNA polymerase sigma-70 factor (ECF subfamily)
MTPPTLLKSRPARASREVASDHSPDRALIERVVAGDPGARAQIAVHLARVPAIVEVLVEEVGERVRRQELPDLVQDCLEVVWRRLPSYEGRASLSTWIFRVCELELWNGLRRIRKHALMSSGTDGRLAERASSRDDPARRIERLDLTQALSTLTPIAETIVRLRHFDDLTFERIATLTGLTTGPVKERYYRALGRLHDWFEARDRGSDTR